MDPNMSKSLYLAPCGELNKKKKSTIAQVVDDKIQENADKSREQVINDEEAQEDNLDDMSIEQQVVNDEKIQEHSLDDVKYGILLRYHTYVNLSSQDNEVQI